MTARPRSRQTGRVRAEKSDHADENQDRRQRGQMIGIGLRHQAGAEIGAQHDGQRRRRRDHAARGEGRRHHRGGHGALQQQRDAEAGAERQSAAIAMLRPSRPRSSPPKARNTPVRTMRRPQTSSAAAPSRFSRKISLPEMTELQTAASASRQCR